MALAVSLAPATAGGAAGPAAEAGPTWAVDRLRVEGLPPGEFLSVDGIGDFRGALEVVRSGAGVALVNEVGLEDYVRGIAEMPASWPMEALRAQAIAARTYALHTMGQRTGAPANALGADICATQACQVYVGLAKERSEAGGRWVQAVESTRGQVLVKKGAPILAMYSSGEPLPPLVPSPPTGGGPPPPPAPPKGQPTGPPPPPSPPPPVAAPAPLLPLPPLVPVPPAPAPVPTAPPQGPARVVAGAPAPPPAGVVPSARFRGHGIGMSQFGAMERAVRGAKAGAILAGYYKGAKVTQLPPERLPATIRVALEPVRSSMAVGGPARFRLLDGAGRVLAVAASGSWRVAGGPSGQLRVTPPPGQHEAPVVEPLGYEPSAPAPGGAVLLRFRLSTPAVVSATVEGPAGPVAVGPGPRLMEPEESELGLGPLTQPGRYVVSIVADAGRDRVAAVPVTLVVSAADRRASASAALGTGGRPPPARWTSPAGVALLVWALALVTFVRVGLPFPARRSPAGPR